MNQLWHASLVKCSPAEPTYGTEGKVSLPSSTHKVVPFNNVRRKDCQGIREGKSRSSSPYELLVFLYRRPSVTPTAACSQRIISYQGFLAAASCLLQPLPCCRVVSTSSHRPTGFPRYEMALHHQTSQSRALPYWHASALNRDHL